MKTAMALGIICYLVVGQISMVLFHMKMLFFGPKYPIDITSWDGFMQSVGGYFLLLCQRLLGWPYYLHKLVFK